MKLENITVSKRSRSQEAVWYIFPFAWNGQNRQIHRHRKWWFSGCQELGGRGESGIPANRHGVSLGVTKCSNFKVWCALHNSAMLKTTGLYPVKVRILWCVNCMSIKLLYKKFLSYSIKTMCPYVFLLLLELDYGLPSSLRIVHSQWTQ